MFAKLKQKIQEEGAGFTGTSYTGNSGVLLDTTSRSGSAAPGVNEGATGRKTLRSNGSSMDSLNELGHGCMDQRVNQNATQAFSITDSPTSPVRQDDDGCHDPEQRIKELTRLLREESRQKEKLQAVLEKHHDSQNKKSEGSELEWKKKLECLEADCAALTTKLEEASSWKDIYIRDHEAVEELEGFQIQELAKVKHLFLISQHELQQTKDAMKAQESDLESFKMRCSSLEEELATVKENCQRLEEDSAVAKELVRRESDAIGELQNMNDSHGEKVRDLSQQVEDKTCETQHKQVSELLSSLESSRQEIEQLTAKIQEQELTISQKSQNEKNLQDKCSFLELNMKTVSEEFKTLHKNHTELLKETDALKLEVLMVREERKNEVEMMQAKHEEFRKALESAEDDGQTLRKTVSDLEMVMDTNNTDGSKRIKELQGVVACLETQLSEKNKTIKLQQQRIGDIKKTLQRELKVQSGPMEPNLSDVLGRDATLQMNHVPSNVPLGSFSHGRPCSLADKLDDINFRYIKHVILKFITSTEYEAQHLIKAIGVLLDFTREEEQLVRETLYWKTTWFGSKPQMMRPHVGNRTVMS